MGEILAFSPKPPAGDWTANERGLLMLLTQQLAGSYGEVDGVFGQTDSGDPWYVVTDGNQDVLVHIARINGQFVVHDAAIDMLHQVSSLWNALRHVLSSGGPDEQGGVVVAFNPSSREAQSFLSLVIAVGLYLELRGVELGEAGRLNFENLPRVDDPAIEGVASKLIAALNLEADRSQHHATPSAESAGEAAATPSTKLVTAHGVAIEAVAQGRDGLPAVQASPVNPAPSTSWSATASREEAPEGRFELIASGGGLGELGLADAKSVMAGAAGDDVLIGGAEGDTIAGGAGDDYIEGGGARRGQIDRLDGGAGDDRIVMNARVVASGSAGADTFLISAKEPADKIEALLGVVLDYSAARGDHLAVMGKGQVTVVSATAVNDVLAAQGAALGETNVAQLAGVNSTVAGTRVGFDLNGDGREDVFILLGGANVGTFRVGTAVANDHTPAPEVPLVGQPSPDSGHYGEPTGPR